MNPTPITKVQRLMLERESAAKPQTIVIDPNDYIKDRVITLEEKNQAMNDARNGKILPTTAAQIVQSYYKQQAKR